MSTASNAVNLLQAAADITRNGHYAAARKVAEHALQILRELAPREPEKAADVLARHEWKVGSGE